MTFDPFDSELRKDDIVVIRNCPPISALKRFTLEKIIKSPETERDIARASKAQETAVTRRSTTV